MKCCAKSYLPLLGNHPSPGVTHSPGLLQRGACLVERSFQGKQTGRVLLWTTPLARVSDSRLKTAWNEFALPVGENWSFFLPMKQTVPYLAGTSSEQLNFEVGQDAILPIDPTRRVQELRDAE